MRWKIFFRFLILLIPPCRCRLFVQGLPLLAAMAVEVQPRAAAALFSLLIRVETIIQTFCR